jgi:hypothetical protein
MFHFSYAVPKITEVRHASQRVTKNRPDSQTIDQLHKIIKLFFPIVL